MVIVPLKRFREGLLLKQGHPTDAGWDVFAEHDVFLEAHETKKIPLGFGIVLENDTLGVIMPRTSLSARGLVVHMCPIDPGYTGEIHAIITNTSNRSLFLHCGDAIGQLVIQPVFRPTWYYGKYRWDNKKDPLIKPGSNEPRGDGAFGSTNEA